MTSQQSILDQYEPYTSNGSVVLGDGSSLRIFHIGLLLCNKNLILFTHMGAKSPPHANIIGSKWIFLTKYHSGGTIDRYKAQLIAQGFTQTPGLDLSLTFSPIVKAAIVRVILALSVHFKWVFISWMLIMLSSMEFFINRFTWFNPLDLLILNFRIMSIA
ncbi:unnamed protein product [Cuscuta epithymum]|uniref:Reverse transcriptase Ty1/copia-type domain-containing protein n=1 Tax=Cuscuta epithymum TaxID=186058 RepID=A0AAV0DNY7_9ASTE|nr:unnamed protein product [Cuscuta epithymum]